MTHDEVGGLDRTLDWLVGPALSRTASGLAEVAGLAVTEADAVLAATREALLDVLRRKVIRVLVLELNAARVTGRLTASDPEGRWREFVASAQRPEFWQDLTKHYPKLVDRLTAVTDRRVAAVLAFARRFAADRDALTDLLGGPAGELRAVEIGAGDSHHGGHTVVIVRCTGGTVVYKPRPMEVDRELAGLVSVLSDAIRVPRAVVRDGYGWAEHVDHRYCADETELVRFYRALGHWLAVMRLVSGTDLHAENLIAHGPVPVVVDCESVFTPRPAHPSTGAGEATDLVAEQLTGTVMRTGLLPGRGAGLGWRGVDGSGMGGLPGEQPEIGIPDLVGAGTDTARVETVPHRVPTTANLPSPEPDLVRYWPEVVAGFDELAERITALDKAGELEQALYRFADVTVRVIVRDTESYTELARMLWHPAGLHDQDAAELKARTLLARHSMNTRGPGDPDVHVAEVADLLVGDIPVFTTTPAEGTLHTPGDHRCMPRADQIALALRRWRDADFALERRVTQAALVSAYLNQGGTPDLHRMSEPTSNRSDVDGRRRVLAARLVRELLGEAVRGTDGTATWFAPVLDRGGWQTTPLTPDLYGGTLGVAVLLAGYRNEVAAGRADEVDGVDDLLAATVRTARLTQEWWMAQLAHTKRRPDPVGAYIGLGSQIWCWLTLHRLGLDCLPDALFLADHVPAALAASEGPDLVVGTAGAIVPLLALAARTGDRRWHALAVEAGERLVATALVEDGKARWPAPTWPGGIGGFAHGATGIGWSLDRLVLAGEERFAEVARAAAAFEESVYDPDRQGWPDPRAADTLAAAWCHGAVGVGLAQADLLDRGGPGSRGVLRRAAESALRDGLGWTHTLCHGDSGTWELLVAALDHGVAPEGLDRAAVDARLIGGLEAHGAVTGLAREVYSPSMMSGSGGIAYQLLRLHPDCALPSVLVLADADGTERR
ncbi:type 2 lanthipeptide synthetase LanM family protein [Saccharothrix violaceirubra]|uniref:Type 2 lantibiotic biosynthesis protein LanM n=1 Tax=Saccharothrix violaceirubra TaxID=413306 RepID=A0A7W7T247_9PSEU|nr:type 2 lanthipeptide synthetase LanM family protein [Saccharothrix violaceirubra]MBB4965154.1 type 2 lantibiotic biosynthesis protein LanM [Saccharothrix violaceirubra]